jgi:hypothetical protein
MLPIQSRSLSEGRASRTLTVTVGPKNTTSQKTRPGQFASAIRPGRLELIAREVILQRITYCFGGAAGASAGGGAAVPSAGGAAGASAAGAAGASAAGAAGAASVVAGGAAAVSGLAASCFAQAVSISAATSALRASLVFIDRYPKEKQEWYENDMNEFGRSASPVRIAAANSIESPLDLKQSERVVCRLRHPVTAVCARHTTDSLTR